LDPVVPTPQEITRHHADAEVVYVGAHRTGYAPRIEEPDPSWPDRYRALEVQLRDALGDRVLDVQHIGSTSVPGLPAKPIIDVDLTVADPSDEAAYVPDLEVLGYVHWLSEPDWHGHRLLKQLDEPRVHLHVFGPGCPEVVRHRMFRDWLTTHHEDRELYAAAKREAAARLASTRADDDVLDAGMRYNRIKEPVVREIYDRMFRAAGLID
jgi:GrpB-like predicted nucleotidyltransferase (UPF0157 family)